MKELEGAARALRTQLHPQGVRLPDELDHAFSAARASADALYVFLDALFLSQRNRIAALANQYRLPAMYGTREYIEVGGLMAYGVNFAEMYQRTAAFVDKILKGAKPANLPVECPTRFELHINLKTAQALGLTISPSLFLRADHVIE